MDAFEKKYIKNKLRPSKKQKNKTQQPEKVFEDFAKKISEIIINNEPIAAKIIREKSTKLSIKTNYLQGFATDKHKTQSKNPAKPSLSFEKSFVSHGAIDYDFVLMEAKREEEMLHHEMHGHDSHGDDGSAATREGPLTPPFAEPYYSFLTLTSPPIASISASYCGETNISGNTFYNTSYDGSFQSFDGLYWIAFGFGEIAEAWSIFDFISFIELYRNTIDFREDVVPLTGWVSLDPSYDPVPTLSLSSTPESFFCGNIDDSPPSFGPEDFFPNNDYTVLYATTSSSRVPSIKTLYFSNLAIQNANFSKFTSLSSLTLRYSTSIEALDLSKNNQLQYLNLDNCISLSSLNLNSNNLKQVYLAAAPLLHDSVDAMFASVYASPNASYFGYLGTSEGRSAASNNAFIDLYKRNVQVLPLEIDPSYPVLNPPDYYVSSSLQGNSLSIMNPVSTLGASITRSKTLTGVYLKTGDVLNNRDVFRNNKDYCVVYNSNLKLWTLVGPGSSSTTVWLSADAGVGDWGNPPNLGWRGIAYSVGNDASNRWWQTTRLQTTQTMAYSGTFNYPYYGNPNNLMNLYDPASGINSNFRWKHLDFTGRVFSNANPTNPYQSVQGRGTLISPVHFLYAVHFNPWLRPYQPANNDTCKIYDAAGNATTVTVLSSLIVPGGFDTGVAILSQPVSSTQYFLLSGRNNYLRALSAPDSFNNYLVGPTQTGTVGVGLPYYDQDIQLNFITDSSATSYADYRDIYSIPHSEWHGGNIITGDSSTQAWVVSGNRLLLAGHTYYGGNKITGPYYGHRLTSIIHCLTTLNQVYYGNAFAYSLTAVSFD